jgi:lysophospholipase L1-like esterase
VVSYGWAGARVADLPATQLPRSLEPLRENEAAPFLPGADIVALVVGSNDATHRTKPKRYRADLRRSLEIVRQSAPQARVVLAGIPAFRGALRAIEPLISLADMYARLLRPISRAEAARAGVAYADLARHVPPRIDRSTEFLSSDQFHPSAVGYGIWADVIFEALVGDSVGTAQTVAPMEPAGA